MTTAPSNQSNRIDKMFARCREENRAALVLYLTSGFPSEDVTRRVLSVVEEAGCDLIELGVPFSDPIADGPTIQRASTISLGAGMTFPRTLAVLSDFRKNSELPLILFGALNPFLRRGFDKSTKLAREAGADGILAADLPVEEADELRDHCRSEGLHLINLIAPTTPDKRVAQISERSSGFLYCIAIKGVTGARQEMSASARDYLDRLRRQTDLPLALGFGISQPTHVRAAVDAGADAVVVGSALINKIEETIDQGGDLEKEVSDFIRSLAAELKR